MLEIDDKVIADIKFNNWNPFFIILLNPDSFKLYSLRKSFSSSFDNEEISCSIEAHILIISLF